MNKKWLAGCVVAATAVASMGCSVNTNKATSWGKEGVSLLDYETDTILCGTLAEQANPDGTVNAAGGVNGKNGAGRIPGGDGNGAGNSGSVGNAASIGGGTYDGHASTDYVSRAANQQRAQEMQLKQARVESLRSCLVKRGYSEFELTPEQRSELAQLPQGSAERRDYLYKLGTNPDFLKHKPSITK
jgi:hypothetical protein